MFLGGIYFNHDFCQITFLLIDTIFPSFRELNGIEEFFKYQTNLTLLTKVRLVKAMVFPVVKYSCDSWSIKQAECQRINAFEL